MYQIGEIKGIRIFAETNNQDDANVMLAIFKAALSPLVQAKFCQYCGKSTQGQFVDGRPAYNCCVDCRLAFCLTILDKVRE